MAVLKGISLLLCFCSLSVPLLPATWNLNAAGNWNVDANWTAPSVFPNGVDAVANFGNIITANRTITLGIPITVGTVTFDDNNNYTITANTLTFQTSVGNASLTVTNVNGSGAHSIASAVSLASSLNMTHSSTANFTISGAISGANGIIKNGAGTGAFVLSNTGNSYGGTTTINQGTLNYGAAGCIPTTSVVTVGNGVSTAQLTIAAVMTSANAFPAIVNTNGTIAPNSNMTTFLSSLQGSGSIALALVTGNANLFEIFGSTSTTFSGSITGGAISTSTSPEAGNRLTKAGTSTLTLTGTSSYLSRTFIAQGIIDLQSATGLGGAGTTSGVFVRAIGTQGSLYIDGNGLTVQKTLFLNGPGFASGALRNMNGNNTITGGVQIGWTGGTETPATDATVNIDLGTQLTLSGVISGSSNLTLTGGGTAVYSGTSANTMSGTTTINAGSLQLNKTAGVNALAGNVTISPTATLLLDAPNQIKNTSIVTLNGGTFNMAGNAVTIGSLIFNTGTLSQGGAALSLASTAATALSLSDAISIPGDISFTAAGGVTYTGTTTRATLSGNVSLGTTAHTFNIADGTDTIDMDISGVVSGTGSITKSTGTGVLQFSGSSSNTYSGATTINAGSLLLNKTAGTTAVGGNLNINAGGTVTLLAGEQIIDTSVVTVTGGAFNLNGNPETIGRFVLNSGTLSQGGALLTLTSNGGSTLLMGDGTSITGNVAMTGSGTVVYNGTTNAATLSGNLDLGSSTHTFNIANGTASSDMIISGVISGSGGITRLTAAGRLEFSGNSPNTYTGLTTPSIGDIFLNKTAGVTAIAGNITFNDSSGSLTLGASEQIASTSIMNLTSGTFNMAGFSETIATLNFNSGTLTQAGGTLSLASSGTALTMLNTTISGPLAITAGGAVVFNNTSNGTATISGTFDLGASTPSFNIADGTAAIDMLISGAISSSGAGVTKIGAGLLEFSGATSNTYPGLTTVSAGALVLNKTAGVNAIAGDASINGGTLSLGAASQIANTSTITLSSGTFDLGGFAETIGTLNYTGGVLSQGGATLTLASAATALSMQSMTISGNLAIAGGGAIVFDATNNGTATISGNLDLGTLTPTFNIPRGTADIDMLVSGSISSSGAGMTKIGSGILELSGSAAVGGLTSINAGTLVVNGSLGGAGAISVASGALLKGTGAISKNATFNGILSPGNSIGTIHFVGAETFAAGSTLEIEVNPTTSDLVDIVGSLTIQPGATLNILPDVGVYPLPFTYTIVQTTAGVFGTFSTVTSSLPMFVLSPAYTSLDVLLRLSFVPFSDFVTKGNAAKVAQCLDVLPAPIGSDFALVNNILRFLPSLAAIKEALIQMQPSAFTALALTQEESTLYVSNAILNRLDAISPYCKPEVQNNHVWFASLGGYLQQNSRHQEPGFQATSPGVVVGFDHTFAQHLCFGGSLGYTHSHLRWKQDRGHADIQAIYAALYSKWYGSLGYLEGSVMGGCNFYHTDRHIQFSSINSIDRHAKGTHGGQEGSLNCKGALTFNWQHATLAPFARLDFVLLRENSFQESGAKSLNLAIKAKNSNFLSTEGGLDFSYCFTPADKTVTPFLRVSAIRESRFSGKKEKASLGKACSMTVEGLNPTQTLLGTYLGFNAAFPSALSNLSFIYRGKYGNHFQDHSLYLQFAFGF